MAKCLCSDPGCPVCGGNCSNEVEMTVYRSDMDDETGTDMCGGCGSDCLESGVFNTKDDGEDESESEIVWKSASELQGPTLKLITNSQDVADLLDYLGIDDGDITAAIVEVGDGDYTQVWLTEDARYYELTAQYTTPAYYDNSPAAIP